MAILVKVLIMMTILMFINVEQIYSNLPTFSVKKTKVIILGAGISGAGAATTLNRYGINEFVILEAQSVIGGRMKQGKISGINVEMGANWVEGVGGTSLNPIWTLAKKYNLSLTETHGEDSIMIKEDGTIDTSGVQYVFQEKLDEARELLKNRTRYGLEDISVRNALQLVGWRPMTAVDDCAEYIGIEAAFAGNVELLSAKYSLTDGTYQNFGEGSKFVIDQKGYKTIPENLFKEANAIDKIIFGAVVTEIIYNNDGVIVKTTNGDIWEAEYLISTVSLGVYQNEQIKFSPALPSWKMESLFKFKMETYTKIFLEFPSKFWSNHEFTFVASNEKGYYAAFENLMTIKFISDNVDQNKYLMFVTVTGVQSRRVERLTDEEIKDEIVQVFVKMYPGKKIPRPTAILVPRWGQDPLFFGSFTNWPVGMTIESWTNLVAPLNKRLFFGGEMASFNYYGYVHGGYLAGIDQAKKVVRCITGKCPVFKYYPEGAKMLVEPEYILE